MSSRSRGSPKKANEAGKTIEGFQVSTAPGRNTPVSALLCEHSIHISWSRNHQIFSKLVFKVSLIGGPNRSMSMITSASNGSGSASRDVAPVLVIRWCLSGVSNEIRSAGGVSVKMGMQSLIKNCWSLHASKNYAGRRKAYGSMLSVVHFVHPHFKPYSDKVWKPCIKSTSVSGKSLPLDASVGVFKLDPDACSTQGINHAWCAGSKGQQVSQNQATKE